MLGTAAWFKSLIKGFRCPEGPRADRGDFDTQVGNDRDTNDKDRRR
jgi:hypothetical protein